MESYSLLLILNLLNIFIKNNLLISSLFTLIWSKLFISNLNVQAFLVLSLLFINTIYVYIIKYKYPKNKNKIPLIVSINNVILSAVILELFRNNFFENKVKYFKISNFIMIMYIISSIIERVGHKYVMHCDVNGKFNKLSKKYFITRKLFSDICESHNYHHREVKPNMKLDLNLHKHKFHGLFMTWDIAAIVFLITFTVSLFINKTLNFHMNTKYIVIWVIVASILWCYFWNKTHPKMHESDIEFNINDGPIEHVSDMDTLTKCLIDNHRNHHLQKGKKKGNYNVIFLGADEWFNNNVTEIDNLNYCKTHLKEEICKK